MRHALARRPLRVTRVLVLGKAAACQTAHRCQMPNEAMVAEPRLTEARTNAMAVGAMDTGAGTASAATFSICVMCVRTRRTC